jgi:hypothetical protein
LGLIRIIKINNLDNADQPQISIYY